MARDKSGLVAYRPDATRLRAVREPKKTGAAAHPPVIHKAPEPLSKRASKPICR